MNTKHSPTQTRHGTHSAAKTTCMLIAAVILCELAVSEALGQDPCQDVFKKCSACVDLLAQDSRTGLSRNNKGTCEVTDNYFNKATDRYASEQLKACQRCLDQTPLSGATEEKKRLPIIFLPGVAGTILSSGSPMPILSPGDAELWPLAPRGDRADLALEPDGVKSARSARIVVGDVLRRSGMNFYGGFIESLKSLGYTEGTDLLTFPYDWRYSNDVHFARLDQVIQNALSQSGKQKVILIAHSMGGVVARAYVYSSPERAAKVDSFITMGTPYGGATKVYYGVVNGYQFGNDTVRQELMKILMQNYASAYQLLPQQPFVYDMSQGERLVSLDEANTIRYKWFTDARLSFIRDSYTETAGNERFFNPGLLQLAKQFMSGAVDANGNPKPLPGGVKQYAIIGTGVSTLSAYKLEDWKPGTFFAGSYLELGNGRKVVMNPVSGDGDGTVPLWSLETPVATRTYYIPYKSGFITDESSAHGDLPANKTVQSIVAQIIQNSSPDASKYPRPQQYMNKPMTPGKVLEPIVEFELHSDAHLRITHASGKALGFNNAGGIDETLPGTFLAMDGLEYASLAEIDIPVTATVTGIREGKFTLDVKVKRPGGSTTQVSYQEVAVKNGTVAQVTLIPSRLPAPPMSVMTDGKTTMVSAAGGSGTSTGPMPSTGNPPVAGGVDDLSGLWTDDTRGGGIYRLRQIGSKLYWGVDAVSKGSFANVYHGEISGNAINGEWVDVPGSPTLSGGRMTLRIESNCKLVKTSSSNHYGAQFWVKQGSNCDVVGVVQKVVPTGVENPKVAIAENAKSATQVRPADTTAASTRTRTDQPKVEEIPDEVVATSRPPTRSRPANTTAASTRTRTDQLKVEEIPETSINQPQHAGDIDPFTAKPRTAQPQGDINPITGKPRTARPQVEEIPEEAVRPNRARTGENPGSVIGTAQQPSTQRQPIGERWILESATVSPENPRVTWPDGTWTYSAESSSAHYSIYNGGIQADFQWTPPPQQIDSNGFTVSLSVQATDGTGGRITMGISVSGSGLNSDTPNDEEHRSASASADKMAGRPSANAQKSVTFKPIPNTNEIEVRVHMGWAVTFTYKYRRVQ
ncbi:hypothetical protein BH20ACI3_BH20ACI3_38060 [soil metagenome]